MFCKHWDLFDTVHAEDGVDYVPFEWIGNGTLDAYALMAEDKPDKDGEIRKYVLRDFYAQFDGDTITIAEYNGIVMDNWKEYNLEDSFLIAEN